MDERRGRIIDVLGLRRFPGRLQTADAGRFFAPCFGGLICRVCRRKTLFAFRRPLRGMDMRRNHLIAIALTAGLAGAALAAGARPSAAQTASQVDLSKLAALRADLRIAVREEADIIAAITEGVEDAKPLLEEHRSRIAQSEALKPEGEALRTALISQHSDAEKQHAAVAAHNAECPHETKDAALLAKCNGEIGHLNAWAGRLKAESERLEPAKAKYNKEVAEIQQRDREIVARLTELRTADAEQRQKLEAVRARLADFGAALANARTRCREIESAPENLGNAEALTQCRALARGDAAGDEHPAPADEKE
jgi:chromosome segregation ATPase